jgi:hypothetical protein
LPVNRLPVNLLPVNRLPVNLLPVAGCLFLRGRRLTRSCRMLRSALARTSPKVDPCAVTGNWNWQPVNRSPVTIGAREDVPNAGACAVTGNRELATG